MSDWTTKEKCLQVIQDGYENAYYNNTAILMSAHTDGDNAWSVGNDHAAIFHLLHALYWSIDLFNELLQAHDTVMDRYALPYYLQEYTGVTAKAICEAWAKNEFEDRALTIAFIDRQRQLLWDEPFYIAWAARPESESK